MAAGSLLLPQPPQTLRLVPLHLQQEVTGWMSSVNLQRKKTKNQIYTFICKSQISCCTNLKHCDWDDNLLSKIISIVDLTKLVEIPVVHFNQSVNSEMCVTQPLK